MQQLQRWRARVESWFPERHLYVRQGGEMRAFVLSQRKQMVVAGGLAVAVPGKVSFTGVRTGYGNTVEVDHGGGFKTRYAHLASIGVRPGQQVAVGARLGGMGSTGRSTGTHLHYEVWVGGKVQNPARFVRAGSYVLQGG